MITSALTSGAVGAMALTLAHQSLSRARRDAPRMDVYGERAIAGAARAIGWQPPRGKRLHEAALAGDLVSNSLYYSLVGWGSPGTAPARGALLGLLAGVGAVLLPGPLGLGTAPSNRTSATKAMTVGLYLWGGLTAGVAYCVARSVLASKEAA